MERIFKPADILLPDFLKTDGTKWACIACDQYTSEEEYWKKTEEIVGDAPSTLNLILPEVYLSETEERLPKISCAMEKYLETVFISHPEGMIYLERVQSDGTIRRGIIGMVDLEAYEYSKGASSLIRATEGTVLERIPPRVHIRETASIELPHIMLLIDDDKKTVIERIAEGSDKLKDAYEFDLMQGAGHVKAKWLGKEEIDLVCSTLEGLIVPEEIERRYGDASIAPLLFAVGDGNHSLASAKAHYENVKMKIGLEAALTHPSRYALTEVVNLHDEALNFEPIYRVVFNVCADELVSGFKEYAKKLCGKADAQKIRLVVCGKNDEEITVQHPEAQLAVGTLQAFLDEYKKSHPDAEIDYIHGEDSVRGLVKGEDTVGFLFDGMEKDQLFKTVIFDGALPRKTFSMGHADDKRFYIEGRRIR